MLDVARSQVRTKARAQPQRFKWGIVDVILAVLMLPFGVWFLLIEGMVRGITSIGRR